MSETLQELIARLDGLAKQAAQRPWVLADQDHFGENWIVAMMGWGKRPDSDEGCEWAITTDSVHASEKVGDAVDDASFIITLANAYPALRAAALRCGGLEQKLQEADLDIVRMYTRNPNLTVQDIVSKARDAGLDVGE